MGWNYLSIPKLQRLQVISSHMSMKMWPKFNSNLSPDSCKHKTNRVRFFPFGHVEKRIFRRHGSCPGQQNASKIRSSTVLVIEENIINASTV